MIYDKIPLTSKYLYFIKCWAISLETRKNKNVKFRAIAGVAKSPILSSIVCNVALDGFQDFIQDNLPNRYKRSREELDCLRYQIGKKPSSLAFHAYLRVFCIRYVDDMLILGKCFKLYFKRIQNLLVKFLSQKGLEIKNAFLFQGKRFKPGFFIDYLGFRFKYPNMNSVNFDKGKYTKFKFSPINIVDETLSRYARSGPYLLVQSSFMKKIKNSLKVQLSKKNSYISAKIMIGKVNTILRINLNYYNLTSTIKKQL